LEQTQNLGVGGFWEEHLINDVVLEPLPRDFDVERDEGTQMLGERGEAKCIVVEREVFQLQRTSDRHLCEEMAEAWIFAVCWKYLFLVVPDVWSLDVVFQCQALDSGAFGKRSAEGMDHTSEGVFPARLQG
jgi:hypothetical protein